MSIQSYLKSHPLIHLTDTCLRSCYLPDIVLGPWDIYVRETNNRSISCGSYILEGCASYCCCVINFPQILAALNSHHFSHSSWFCVAGTRRGPAGQFFASVSCGGGGVPLERQRQLLLTLLLPWWHVWALLGPKHPVGAPPMWSSDLLHGGSGLPQRGFQETRVQAARLLAFRYHLMSLPPRSAGDTGQPDTLL